MEVPQLEKIPDEYELQFEASTATATGPLWIRPTGRLKRRADRGAERRDPQDERHTSRSTEWADQCLI